MPKEKPKVNIGEVIRSYRSDRGLSQGDIERRTGLLRCYLSRVENGHTVPSLETLAKIAEAMEISLADFFPGSDTPQDRETRKMLGELSEEEIRFLADIKKYSTTLSEDDKKLVLAMIRKMATIIPPVRSRRSRIIAARARLMRTSPLRQAATLLATHEKHKSVRYPTTLLSATIDMG
jgi:transcriptional regulator with XRE-family HTH domain